MAPYAAIQYIRKRIGYDDFLKEYAFTHQINRSDLNEVLAEIEEAAKAFSSVEEWFAHVEEYTETLKAKEKESFPSCLRVARLFRFALRANWWIRRQ